jgi:hypothetical protein
MRVSKAKHFRSAGIYTVDFAACPEILPRPHAMIRCPPVLFISAVGIIFSGIII